MTYFREVLYTAGPMTNQVEGNKPAFIEAAATLRNMGKIVVSPVELDADEGYDSANAERDNEDMDRYAHFLARDIDRIASEVQGVVALPGWGRSGGARAEVAFARALRLPVYRYPSLRPLRRWRIALAWLLHA